MPIAPPIKLVVSGPVGAGKTTFVQTAADFSILNTDETASERIGKKTTTVALDFGKLLIGDQEILLFGTPGQERFDFMWSVLCEGATGLLLLVAAHRPGTFLKARHILEYITSQLPLPFLIGVTHRDAARVWELSAIAKFFGVAEADLLSIDPRHRPETSRALIRLLERCAAPAAQA